VATILKILPLFVGFTSCTAEILYGNSLFMTCCFVSCADGYNGFLRQPSYGFRGTAKHFLRHFVQFAVRKHCWSAAT
jgi:hypothetical protein